MQPKKNSASPYMTVGSTGDVVVAIDPDAKSGMTPVSASNIVSLLRGSDEVGSQVRLSVLKGGNGMGRASRGSVERCEFTLRRADFRAVERAKDLYMSIAELRYASFGRF